MSGFEFTSVWRGAEVTAQVKALSDKGAKLAADHLLAKSQEVVPYLTGALHDSGAVTQVEEGEYAVSYNTSYAVAVHEDVARHHPHGKISKYLEKPMMEEASVMFRMIGGTVQIP